MIRPTTSHPPLPLSSASIHSPTFIFFPEQCIHADKLCNYVFVQAWQCIAHDIDRHHEQLHSSS